MLGVRATTSVTTNGTRSRGGKSLGRASSVPNSMSRVEPSGVAMHIKPYPAARSSALSAMSSTMPWSNSPSSTRVLHSPQAPARQLLGIV
jgi:hypothetical protein